MKKGLLELLLKIFLLHITSIKDKFVHLTNVRINNKNKNYIRPKSLHHKNANIWSVSMYKDFLKSFNVNWHTIREKIKDIIIFIFN